MILTTEEQRQILQRRLLATTCSNLSCWRCIYRESGILREHGHLTSSYAKHPMERYKGNPPMWQKELQRWLKPDILTMAVFKHGHQILRHSSHWEGVCVPFPWVWALWLINQWNVAEGMLSVAQPRALRSWQLLLLALGTHGLGIQPPCCAETQAAPWRGPCGEEQRCLAFSPTWTPSQQPVSTHQPCKASGKWILQPHPSPTWC